MIPIYLIAAMDKQRGIGKDGTLPWHFSVDMRFFAHTTRTTKDPQKRNLLVMGRRTWHSLKGALPGRDHVVLSQNPNYKAEGVPVVSSLDEALSGADPSITESIFIIGGGEIFAQAMQHSHISGLYLTCIDAVYTCDTFFPHFSEKASPVLLQHCIEKGTTLEFFFYDWKTTK